MKDDKEALIRAVREAAEQADFVFLSGGSSVGARDYTKDAITALSGELLFHGLNIKPGKPTLRLCQRLLDTGLARPSGVGAFGPALGFVSVLGRPLRGKTPACDGAGRLSENMALHRAG